MKYKNVVFAIGKFKSISDFGDMGVEFVHEAGTFRIEDFPAAAFKKFCRRAMNSGAKFVMFNCAEVENVDSK